MTPFFPLSNRTCALTPSGRTTWPALSSLHDVFLYVQYDVHYLLGLLSVPHMDHETGFVATFVLPDYQPRWLEFLSKPKRRSSFLHRLADDRDFDSRLRVPIPPAYQTPECVAAQFKKLHAPAACHLISEQTELDGRDMDLLAALEMVIGSGLGTVISCIPGKLAY